MSVKKWLVLTLVVGCLRASRAGGEGGEGGAARLWAGGARLLYDVESAALLNERARRDQEVGWRLHAQLAVTPAACAHHEALLHFELLRPELRLRGAARHAEWVARPSVWDAPAHRAASFYAHWRAGQIVGAYLDPADPPAVAGFKRALISLFQFQIIDGKRNETDVSGDCDVLYETLNELEFRKFKSGCRWQQSDEAGAGVVSRRVTRYSLRPARDAPRELHAEEVLELAAGGAVGGAGGDAGDADAAVKVRAWARLQLAGEAPAAPCAPHAAGLRAPPDALPAALRPATLPLPAPEESEDDIDKEFEDEEPPLSLAAALQLAEALAGEGAGEGGDVPAASALLRAAPVLRAASAAQLSAHLLALGDRQRLTGVARVLGALGTAAALEAGAAALGLGRAAPLQPAADAFLGALAAAPAPAAALPRALLALAAGAGCARVRAGALLAAAAAARAAPADAPLVRADLARQLARCKDDSCRCERLAALGNLRSAEGAALLLEQAARGGAPALCALRALEAAPPAALPWARAARLLPVALNRTQPLAARAAALQLAVRRAAPFPLALAGCARELQRAAGPHAHELRRVFWARLSALAPRHPPVQQFLAAARRDPELGSWHARALAGTSSVLQRSAGWGAGGWRAELDSAQLAAGGVLRRGVVALALAPPARPARPARPRALLSLELWARGLAALAGAQPPAEGAEEEGGDVAGGLELQVAGARLPGITLFSSQAELLGHVWAGTGSSPTPVLRALLPLGARGAALPLLAGVAVRLRASAAAVLAADAHATVSLWSRTASAGLQLRAAVAARAGAALLGPHGAASVLAAAHAPAELTIAADMDFYDAVALCVRASVADHAYSRAGRLRARLAGRRVLRRRAVAVARAGRSLALGRRNDAACRTLAPAPAPAH